MHAVMCTDEDVPFPQAVSSVALFYSTKLEAIFNLWRVTVWQRADSIELLRSERTLVAVGLPVGCCVCVI